MLLSFLVSSQDQGFKARTIILLALKILQQAKNHPGVIQSLKSSQYLIFTLIHATQTLWKLQYLHFSTCYIVSKHCHCSASFSLSVQLQRIASTMTATMRDVMTPMRLSHREMFLILQASPDVTDPPPRPVTTPHNSQLRDRTCRQWGLGVGVQLGTIQLVQRYSLLHKITKKH